MLMTFPHILIFDSGLGGLTVLEAIHDQLPEGRFTFVADNAAFPYGALSEETLIERVISICDYFLPKIQPDILVIACSTASTLVLPLLRARFPLPVVGVVPAIKPAASLTKSKLIALLATPATVNRPDTQALIDTYAQGCSVHRVGSPMLARYAEAEFCGTPATDQELLEAIRPCFIQRQETQTDVIVLGCTHYPLILKRLEKISPWPVSWINPAPAIAQRVVSLLPEFSHTPGKASSQSLGQALFTAPPSALLYHRNFLSRFPFSSITIDPLPFSSPITTQ
jgi:glutamate racemase